MQPFNFFSNILFTNTCVICIALVQLHSWFVINKSNFVLSKNPVNMNPALLNTTCTSISFVFSSISRKYDPSRRPKFTPIFLNSRSGCCFLSSSNVSSKIVSFRETNTTFNPCSANSFAKDLPIPDDAPVTKAHFAPLYFFFKFCVGMNETMSLGTQYERYVMAPKNANMMSTKTCTSSLCTKDFTFECARSNTLRIASIFNVFCVGSCRAPPRKEKPPILD
mmetsp:Transcript_6206/g.20784  ORF Transcript_6206/g.20784 Transcript_6206/m.20784 type:complete len:222 (+) Transcript_6206:455-1120(+)